MDTARADVECPAQGLGQCVRPLQLVVGHPVASPVRYHTNPYRPGLAAAGLLFGPEVGRLDLTVVTALAVADHKMDIRRTAICQSGQQRQFTNISAAGLAVNDLDPVPLDRLGPDRIANHLFNGVQTKITRQTVSPRAGTVMVQ